MIWQIDEIYNDLGVKNSFYVPNDVYTYVCF